MTRPKVKHTDTIHEGYCSVYIDHLETGAEKLYPYTRLEFGFDATAVLAQTPEGKLVINEEFRIPPSLSILSAAGGKIDPGESPVQAALRELLEETGYFSDEPIYLGATYPFPAMSSQQIHFVLAKNAILKQEPNREPLEQINTVLMNERELNQRILEGAPVDGILCTALYLKTIHNPKK